MTEKVSKEAVGMDKNKHNVQLVKLTPVLPLEGFKGNYDSFSTRSGDIDRLEMSIGEVSNVDPIEPVRLI